VTKLLAGFDAFVTAGLVDGPVPSLYGAQAAGCAPIVRLVEGGGDRISPVIPNTLARSLAIGNPADGALAAKAIRRTGGWASAVSDEELVAGIRLLAEHAGVFTETAGGVTVAAAQRLARAGRLGADDEVVLCVTGNGLKTVESARAALHAEPPIPAKLAVVAALVEQSPNRPALRPLRPPDQLIPLAQETP
jgi:threonine synthase